MFYRVMNTFIDTINGHHISAGHFVETEELAWVNRFGSTLKEEQLVPPNSVVVKIENTKEGMKKEPVKAEPVKAEPVKEAKLVRADTPNKAVLSPENK